EQPGFGRLQDLQTWTGNSSSSTPWPKPCRVAGRTAERRRSGLVRLRDDRPVMIVSSLPYGVLLWPTRVAKEVSAMSTPTHPRGRVNLSDPATMPTDISGQLSLFDRVATHADRFASRAWFFATCMLLVVVWAPSFF